MAAGIPIFYFDIPYMAQLPARFQVVILKGPCRSSDLEGVSSRWADIKRALERSGYSVSETGLVRSDDFLSDEEIYWHAECRRA